MKKNRLFAILICLILLVSIAACNKDAGGSASSPPASGGSSNSPSSSASPGDSGGSSSGGSGDSQGAASARDTLTIAVTADSGTLNPIRMSGDFAVITRCIQESMWDIDEYGNFRWFLATSVDEVALDKWIIHLREGVKFSNGSDFKANDVLFSMQMTADGGFSSAPRVQNVDVANCKVIDDYTLEVALWDYHVSAYTILSDFLVFDEDTYDEESFATNPIGTGPYVVDEYMVNSYVHLSRRDDYWGEPSAIPHLVFRVLAEPSQIVNALETGMIDTGPISSDNIDYVKTLPGFHLESRYGQWTAIYFNMFKGIFFDNVDARRAICHAIDRNVITNLVYNGYAKPMFSVVSDAANDYESRFDNADDTYTIGYNVALAKELAQKSGLAGQSIRVITNGTAPHVTMAEIMQDQLKAIDVDVQINNYDVASFMSVVQDPSRSMYEIWIGSVSQINRIVADPMVNGVRYSPAYQEPDVWADIWEFLEVGPQCFYNPDPQKHSDYTFRTLQMYESGVLSYAFCDYEAYTAFSNDLAGPFVWRNNGRLRYADFKFA